MEKSHFKNPPSPTAAVLRVKATDYTSYLAPRTSYLAPRTSALCTHSPFARACDLASHLRLPVLGVELSE